MCTIWKIQFDLIPMNLCQNVCHHEKKTDLKVGHAGSETRILGQITLVLKVRVGSDRLKDKMKK